MLDNPSTEDTLPNIQSKPPLMQLEAISSSCHLHLGRRDDTHLTTASFQVVVESNMVSAESPSLQTEQPSSLSCSSYDLLFGSFTSFIPLLWTHSNTSMCFFDNEGPKTEHSIPGAASPVPSTGTRSPPYSWWPHYSWYKPGCCWPSWPHGHTAGSYSADCWPTPQGPFPPGNFPATLPQACSIAWWCCDLSIGPGTWPCWTSYNWPQTIDQACPDPSAEPFYLQADKHSGPTWCYLQTY